MSSKQTLSIPKHVAIIMDGNGRWAEKRGLPKLAGHRAGAETVRRVIESCNDLGIKYLTLYAFSTENWRRPQDEVSGLMNLLRSFLKKRLPDMQKHNLRLNIIGEFEKLPQDVREELSRAMEVTAANTAGTLTLALSYGSRSEITAAARKLAARVEAGELQAADITEKVFADALYTSDIPDPDLLIRTSGEYRISNFLLWQISYSELWITDTLWPDFSKEEFKRAVEEYGRRERRYGGR